MRDRQGHGSAFSGARGLRLRPPSRSCPTQKDLLGKYILGERLGAGGMAEVFKAVYSPEGGFERVVAIKRILPSWTSSQEFVALFRREAELGSRLAHPNVVQVHDFGADGETFFMAMEFVDGISLGRLLRPREGKQTKLPVPALLWLTHELAAALQYVHSRTDESGRPLGLVHRDLNPPNVLLSRVGEVKVADFGIALSSNRPALTDPGMMRGNLSYAAPEQAMVGAIDGRADLFALGITLYEAAVGARLFGGLSDTEILGRLTTGSAESPADTRSDLPEAFSRTVSRLLERDPAKRPRTGLEVQEGLADLFRAHLAEGRQQVVALVGEAMAGGGPTAQVPSPPEPTVTGRTQTATAPLQGVTKPH